MNTVDLLPIPSAPVEQQAANRRRSDYAIEECLCCGRGMTERAVETAWMVHLTTAGLLAPVDAEVADSQGWHPVGSECAKLIPKSHRCKF